MSGLCSIKVLAGWLLITTRLFTAAWRSGPNHARAIILK